MLTLVVSVAEVCAEMCFTCRLQCSVEMLQSAGTRTMHRPQATHIFTQLYSEAKSSLHKKKKKNRPNSVEDQRKSKYTVQLVKTKTRQQRHTSLLSSLPRQEDSTQYRIM